MKNQAINAQYRPAFCQLDLQLSKAAEKKISPEILAEIKKATGDYSARGSDILVKGTCLKGDPYGAIKLSVSVAGRDTINGKVPPKSIRGIVISHQIGVNHILTSGYSGSWIEALTKIRDVLSISD